MKKIAMTLALAALMTAPLAAQQRQRPAGNPHNNPIMHCLQVVDLSEAQKAQVKTAFDTAAPALRTLHEQLKKDHEALKTLLEATTPDACAIGNAMLKVRTSEKAIQSANEALKAAIEAILTPDQKLKFQGCMDAVKRGPRG